MSTDPNLFEDLYKANMEPTFLDNNLEKIQRNIANYELKHGQDDLIWFYYSMAISVEKTLEGICRKFQSSPFYDIGDATGVAECFQMIATSIYEKANDGKISLSHDSKVMTADLYFEYTEDESALQSEVEIYSNFRAYTLLDKGNVSEQVKNAILNSSDYCTMDLMIEMNLEVNREACINFSKSKEYFSDINIREDQPLLSAAASFCQEHINAVYGEECFRLALDNYTYQPSCVIPLHKLSNKNHSSDRTNTLIESFKYCFEGNVLPNLTASK